MNDQLKAHPTIGCCGIDCGLCPRYQSESISACPGCGGPQFKAKHPSCGFITCCVVKSGLEVCSQCPEFPCNRYNSEIDAYDSFVTHKKVFPNLEYIKTNGIENFLKFQNIKINILKYFLSNFDDGHSKSYFCLSCALLPTEELSCIHSSVIGLVDSMEIKERNKRLKDDLHKASEKHDITLKLNKKK
jgi:hypothetical protein